MPRSDSGSCVNPAGARCSWGAVCPELLLELCPELCLELSVQHRGRRRESTRCPRSLFCLGLPAPFVCFQQPGPLSGVRSYCRHSLVLKFLCFWSELTSLSSLSCSSWVFEHQDSYCRSKTFFGFKSACKSLEFKILTKRCIQVVDKKCSRWERKGLYPSGKLPGQFFTLFPTNLLFMEH